MSFIQYANETVYAGLREIDIFENLDELFNYFFQLTQFFSIYLCSAKRDFKATLLLIFRLNSVNSLRI